MSETSTPTKETLEKESTQQPPIESPITQRDIEKDPPAIVNGFDESSHAVLLIGCPKSTTGHCDYHVDKEKGIMTCSFCMKDLTEEIRAILLMIVDEWGIKLSTLQSPDSSV